MGLKPTKGGGVQKATPKSNVRGRNLPAPGGSQRNRPVNNPKRHVLTIAGGPVKPTFRPILPRPKGTFNVHAEGSKIPLSERFEKINKPRPQPGMPQRFDGPSGANGRRRNAHGVVLPV